MKKIIILLVLIVGIFSYSKNSENTAIVVGKYSNGVPSIVVLIDENNVVKKELTYYQNGNLRSEKDVKNEKYNGEVRLYYPSGKLNVKTYMKDNEFVNELIEYYESGKIQVKEIIKGNKTTYTRYYENGKIEEKGQTENLMRQGRIITYYSNGKIKSEEDYKDDTLNGIFKEYNENGKVNFVRKYKMGKLIP